MTLLQKDYCTAKHAKTARKMKNFKSLFKIICVMVSHFQRVLEFPSLPLCPSCLKKVFAVDSGMLLSLFPPSDVFPPAYRKPFSTEVSGLNRSATFCSPTDCPCTSTHQVDDSWNSTMASIGLFKQASRIHCHPILAKGF
jgi:hypothetical protein